MFAYIDETGNTGANIFDVNQPEFYTAALVTKTNFDLVYKGSLRKVCERQNVDSLHASVLGFGPLEAMAPDILRLLKKSDARFFLSRVEKSYLLVTKVFDTFFDSGENPAVPWTAYNLRHLRINLTFKVASLVDDDLAHRFWKMLMAKSEDKARALIPSICETFLERVESISDARAREIISSAFSWSLAHPNALDIYIPRRQAKNGHMPNMVAFGNLLDGLEFFSQRWKRPVRKVVHDRQSQFEGTLAEWHRMAANASPEPVHFAGETEVLRKVAGSDFEVSASDQSAGIQIADLILWLYRQRLTGKMFPPQSAKVLNFVQKRAWLSDFSFEGVGDAMTERANAINQVPMSPEQMFAGMEYAEVVERNRLKAMEDYEVDGLMPYERRVPSVIQE